jgi:hypothetical protein
MKLSVSMNATYQTDGHIIPECIIWDDGRKFPIDKVLHIKPEYELKSGGTGTRYLCLIGGRERYVYFDGKCWYVDVPDDYRANGEDGC